MQRPKFNTPKMFDFTSKIRQIIEKTSCGRHKAPEGVPCYSLGRDAGGYYAGVCNLRIKKVYNGKVTTEAVKTQKFHTNRRPKKENRG